MDLGVKDSSQGKPLCTEARRTWQGQGHEGQLGLAGLKALWRGWGGGHCNQGQIWKGLECHVRSLDLIT